MDILGLLPSFSLASKIINECLKEKKLLCRADSKLTLGTANESFCSSNSATAADNNVKGSNENNTLFPFFIMNWMDELGERQLENGQKTSSTKNATKQDTGEVKPKNEEAIKKCWVVDTSHDDASQYEVIISSPVTTCSSVTSASLSPSSIERNTPLPLAPSLHSIIPQEEEEEECDQDDDQSCSVTSSPQNQEAEAYGHYLNSEGVQKAKLGFWTEAYSLWSQSLRIRETILDDYHPDIAHTLNNMGIALGKLDRFEDALVVLKDALKIRRDIHGLRHLDVAASLHNIGNIYQRMGLYEGAIGAFGKALDIKIKVLKTKHHVDVGLAYGALGHVHYDHEKFDDAWECYQESLKIYFKVGYEEEEGDYVGGLVKQTKLDIEDVENVLAARVDRSWSFDSQKSNYGGDRKKKGHLKISVKDGRRFRHS